MLKIEEFEKQYSYQLRNSLPIVYKDITFYPCQLSQYESFMMTLSCLLFCQTDYSDLQLMSLPRLYFLTDILNHKNDEKYMASHQELQYLYLCLKGILEITLKHYMFDFKLENGRWLLRVMIPDGNGSFTKRVNINSKDFEMIRTIILNQNGIDYSDEFLHKDIRNYIKEQEDKSNEPSPTIEDYIETMMMELCVFDEKMFDTMSIRRFNRLLHKTLGKEKYLILKTAETTGFVKFKSEIKHWLSKQDISEKYKSMFQKV